MPADRVEVLKNLLTQNPRDSFARYGLATEYAKAGRFEEAVAEYQALVAADPNYLYGYFQGGQTLEKLGRREEARQMYRQGIEAALRAGDEHARSELQEALNQLGA